MIGPTKFSRESAVVSSRAVIMHVPRNFLVVSKE